MARVWLVVLLLLAGSVHAGDSGGGFKQDVKDGAKTAWGGFKKGMREVGKTVSNATKGNGNGNASKGDKDKKDKDKKDKDEDKRD